MRISIIAAVSDNGVIGAEGRLPWHLPADLKHFKEVTTNHHIIMGRKTYESIGKALPNRTNIVLTRNEKFKVDEGVLLLNSLDDAINLAKSSGQTECFIIGGESLYTQALPITDRIYMTTVHTEAKGNAHFPTFNVNDWKISEKVDYKSDSKNPHSYSLIVLDKI